MPGQHVAKHRARRIPFAVGHHHEAALAIRQQQHHRVHAGKGARMRHRPLAIDIGQAEAVGIGVVMRVAMRLAPVGNRHRCACRPHGLALFIGQPGFLSCVRIQPVARPRQHGIKAATNPTRSCRGDDRHDGLIGTVRHIATVTPGMRLRDVVVRRSAPLTHAAIQTERIENLALDQRLVGQSGNGRSQLAGHHVQQVVVGIA